MSRKVTVSKEIILDAALKMLIRDGYASVNIKSLAEEIGCSTQPLVWHFENMEGLRKALAEYAAEYASKKAFQNKVSAKKQNAAEIFESLGRAYVKMAMKEPNLFRFLYLGESPLGKPYDLKDISRNKDSVLMADGIAGMTGISREGAARCIRDTVIYSHGIATMIATGVYNAGEKQIMSMIKSASECFLLREGGTLYE